MKILYISRFLDDNNTGAKYVMQRNLRALQKIAGRDNVIIYMYEKPSIATYFISLLRQGSYGVSVQDEQTVLKIAQSNNYDWVFLEGTLFGNVVKKLRKKGIRTMVYAHNVDAILYKQEMELNSTLTAKLRYIHVSMNERTTLQWTSKLLALTERDNDGFKQLYDRGADIILPITYERHPNNIQVSTLNIKPYLLFVGSNFFPNVEGINWFIDYVATHIDLDVRIVGGCCQNQLLQNRPLPVNVFLDGYVNDLSAFYKEAVAVIIPIFYGSGMKTKTIEALSYGKTIIGTEEAFVGVSADYDRIGGLCNSPEEFIDKISLLDKSIRVNEYSLNVFNSYFSEEIFIDKLRAFINE